MPNWENRRISLANSLVRFKTLLGKNNKLIIILIIVLVVASIILIPTLAHRSGPQSSLHAMIEISGTHYRLSEFITFDANGSGGDIVEYHWEFGDGNYSNEKVTQYQYQFPGHYQVTLIVNGSDKTTDDANVNINVQRDDFVHHEDLDRNVWFGNGHFGVGKQIDIGPNIGNPSIDVEAKLENVVGKIGITIWLEYNDDRFDFSETAYTVANRDFTISVHIEPNELPTEMEGIYSTMDVFIWVDEGQWSRGTLDIYTIFPSESDDLP